jgi:hypothetical protein
LTVGQNVFELLHKIIGDKEAIRDPHGANEEAENEKEFKSPASIMEY